jgi:hypothetical protein
MSIETLKKSVTAQLPLLPQKRRQVAVTPEKLPTKAALEKFDGLNSPPMAWVYWFDPIALVGQILSAPAITKNT